MYSQEDDIFEKIYAFDCGQSIYTVYTRNVQSCQYLVGGGASLNMEPYALVPGIPPACGGG